MARASRGGSACVHGGIVNRVETLNARYAAVKSLVRSSVEIVVVGDPQGALLNTVVRQLLLAVRDDGPGIWDDLVGATKALRWRRVIEPQPTGRNPAVRDSARQVIHEVQRLRGAIASETLLDNVEAAAAAVAESDSPVGAVLMRSVEEVGADACVVVAANRPARAAVENWLAEYGALVVAAGELEREQLDVDLAYVIGPPRLFNAALVTAPVTSEINFLMPAWFADRSVPQSAIAPYAEGAIRVTSRVLHEGDEAGLVFHEAEVEDELLPEPVWGLRQSPRREPASGEVEAHKVLLSGSHAIWLDDGDRIRSLDPTQPVGERVTYIPIDAVRVGTYLLLRRGETEHGALYEEALSLLNDRKEAIDSTQRAWKNRLVERLLELGYNEVVVQLQAKGVRTAERARAWTDPHLIRPHSDHDFECLLEWLEIPFWPTIKHANQLRKKLYQASADVREELETAVSTTDLSDLERTGHLLSEGQVKGVRGILAARVLAISPHSEIVPRQESRTLFEDQSGRWLE